MIIVFNPSTSLNAPSPIDVILLGNVNVPIESINAKFVSADFNFPSTIRYGFIFNPNFFCYFY